MSGAANRLRCAEIDAAREDASALWRRVAALETRLLDAESCERVDLTEAVLPLRAALAALNDATTQLLIAQRALAESTS